jgi:hypothetical protein
MSASRFSYYKPGWGLMIWYMMYSDWNTKMHAWITDHECGERYQLSDDEEVMMNVLSENMDAVADVAKVCFWQLNKFWTPQRIVAARNHILSAISARRHGDAKG